MTADEVQRGAASPRSRNVNVRFWSRRLREARQSLPAACQFLLWTGATVFLFSLIFPPRPWWMPALLCLVPWTVAVVRTEQAWIVHWGSFLGGWVFYLINLSWLMPVTGLGYAALGFYLALYWPLAAWAVRTARRARISPAWSLPVAWVACEYLRAWVMSGFPWLFIGHALYEQVWAIQISDLTGAYGVSFAVLLVNGVLAEWILAGAARRSARRWWTQPLVASVACAGLWLAVWGYGRYRLSQTENIADGPKIAVVQEDFPLVSTPPYGEHLFVVFARYLSLAAQAAAEKPDLLALPETVWGATQNVGFLEVDRQAVDDMTAAAYAYGKHCHRALSAFARGDYQAVNRVLALLERPMPRDVLARQPGGHLPRLPSGGGPPVTVLLGSSSIEVFPQQTYPKQKRFNSALVYDRDGTQRRLRYDKHHLVPFGEFVPFRQEKVLGFDLHWLYRLLNRLSPFSQGGTIEYSMWPGSGFTTFDLNAGGRVWKFGTPICYEDVMPYVSRGFVWDGPRRRADFLVNISNDGWFLHSAELPQHLAICVFRAVENRVAIARSVNTGVSGFIDSDGRLHSIVEKDGRRLGAGVIGFRVDRIKIDGRDSFYGRTGDWFAALCLLLSTICWVGAIVTRWIFGLHRRFVARPIDKGVSRER